MNSHEEILSLLQRYFDALFTGNVEGLRALFHPQAMLVGKIRGLPFTKALEDYLAAVAARQSPQALGESFAMKVLALEVQHDIAYARVSCPMLGFDYTDFLSLIRLDGRWQISHKLFIHHGH